MIPLDELSGGPTEPIVPMRVTSFWHEGDWGGSLPFNIDLHPEVGDPFWMPEEIVSVSGPSRGGSDLPESVDLELFDGIESSVSGAFAMFPSAPATVSDPSSLALFDECTVSEFFFDNPTTVDVRQMGYDYDGVSIQVRLELHDSESAARGAFGLAQSEPALACRSALLADAGVTPSPPQNNYQSDKGAWDRIDIDASGSPLTTSTFVSYEGAVLIRVSTIGEANDTVDDEIVNSIRTTFNF